jgi:hypothetical protein
MAKAGFRVPDSDLHTIEPPDLGARYIDAWFKHRAPRGFAEWVLDPVRSTIAGGTPGRSSRCVVSVDCDADPVKAVVEHGALLRTRLRDVA